MPEKIISYLGFAMRARKLRLGVNAIAAEKKRIYLLVLCATASENTKKDALSMASKLHAKLVVSNFYRVEDLVNKENCKLIAVLDRELSKAILTNLNEHFVIAEAEN